MKYKNNLSSVTLKCIKTFLSVQNPIQDWCKDRFENLAYQTLYKMGLQKEQQKKLRTQGRLSHKKVEQKYWFKLLDQRVKYNKTDLQKVQMTRPVCFKKQNQFVEKPQQGSE